MFNRRSKDISVFHRLSYIVMNNSSSKPSLFLSVRCISKTCSDPSQSFAVSYLKEKLGFSPESALAARNYLLFKTPDKPDSVIAFLEKHGFSKTKIKKIIAARPVLLYSNAEKTLLPKLEFVRSKGRAIKRYPMFLSCKLDAYLLPNINILRDNGAPESNIISMFNYHPRSFIGTADQFKEIVKEVKEMGFNPLWLKFLLAVIIFKKVSKPAMERKLDVYKKWGWSEPEIWEAFRRYPSVMETSEEKIVAIMDFLVNKMGFQSLLIANQPSVIARSFEKRIVPRGLFAQDLLSKGLIKNFGLSALFDTSEKRFVQRFVNQYECKAPELLTLYKEKLDLTIGGKYKSGYS
ncbi:hypothetical protein CRYUN_Cryun40dG0017500 [Craigia yunnanensis]